MDLPLCIPLKPLAIERRGVPNPGAPVRSRAPLKPGWQALLGDKEKFTAFIEKSKEDNKNLMTRMSPSAQRKQRTAVDHCPDVLDPDFDEERYSDTDIIESHGMHMVPVLAEGFVAPENTSQKVALIQAEKEEILLGNTDHQQLVEELEARWTIFLECYVHPKRKTSKPYTCTRVGIKNLLGNKDTVCKVEAVIAEKAQQDVLEQIDAIQVSRKALLKKGQQTKKFAENKKRQRGFDGTTDELESARESFKKPSKILRTTGPVASSSATQLDTSGPVASSSAMRLDTDATDAPESSSDEPVPDHPADDNEGEDDETNRENIQRMYSLARIQPPNYAIEELDEMLEWSQPKEADDPDASTSAAFTSYGLMLSILEPVEADARFEAKIPADNGLYLCDICSRDYPDVEPRDHKSHHHLERHTTMQHTEWKDLLRDMANQSGRGYTCLTDECDYKCKMEEKAQAHLLEECPEKEKYIAIKDAHDKIKAAYLKSEKT